MATSVPSSRPDGQTRCLPRALKRHRVAHSFGGNVHVIFAFGVVIKNVRNSVAVQKWTELLLGGDIPRMNLTRGPLGIVKSYRHDFCPFYHLSQARDSSRLRNSLVRVRHIGALIAIPARSHLATRDSKTAEIEGPALKNLSRPKVEWGLICSPAH